MESYRFSARKQLQNSLSNDSSCVDITTSQTLDFRDVWHYVESNNPQTDLDISETLLAVQLFLDTLEPQYVLPDDCANVVSSLMSWVASVILPAEEFDGVWEEAQLATDERILEIFDDFKSARNKATLGVCLLQRLCDVLHIDQTKDAAYLLSSLAAFTNVADPWTTEEASSAAHSVLDAYERSSRPENQSILALSKDILVRFVKPPFSKTRNPAITPAGRKDVHPVTLPRFDPGIFDKGAKPWKHKEVYVISILSWVVDQYTPSVYAVIEDHFYLLVPAILALIDDESIAYKTEGCRLLTQALYSLGKAKSDILKRTNLDSVFEDALQPCLHFLPTLTPANESTYLLEKAYPAFFAVVRCRYPTSPPSISFYRPAPSQSKSEMKDTQARVEVISRLLRHSILSSYKHTSNPLPTQQTLISSFPYPELSTLLLKQLKIAIRESGIHVVKHLQDIFPILISTLENPFGPSYLPLLLTATQCIKQILMSSWLRAWKWRSEILAGLCNCWLRLREDEEDFFRSYDDLDDPRIRELIGLRKELKTSIKTLRVLLEDTRDLDETAEKFDLNAELKMLTQGEGGLRGLLLETGFSPA